MPNLENKAAEHLELGKNAAEVTQPANAFNETSRRSAVLQLISGNMLQHENDGLQEEGQEEVLTNRMIK